MVLRKWILGFLALAFLSGSARAQTPSFDVWRDQMRQAALQAGVSPQTFDTALAGFEPDERVVTLDGKQPEHKISFKTYLSQTLTRRRLKDASDLKHENARLLSVLTSKYGVPGGIIVALWGIESSFGHHMGNFESIASLATLAYEGRRAAFFQTELIEALLLVQEEGMEPSDLQGSWAGALGQCQFMPSTFRKYAVDYNGDRKRDIWATREDVLASIANYLRAEGWKAGQSWGREVKLTRPLQADLVGLDHAETMNAWQNKGVTLPNGKALPKSALQASLVQPDGPDGRSFLVTDNFRALMRWNRSTYFATTVGLFADQMK